MPEQARPYKWDEFSGEIQRLENQAKAIEMILAKELEILKLKPNMNVLDAGCGTGPVTRTMAKIISPGLVYGIDFNSHYIDSAKKFAENEGITNIRYELGNVEQMKYEDGFFDISYCRLLLMHVYDPVKVVVEMARVTKQGGIVAVSDHDDGGFMVYPPCPTYERIDSNFIKWRTEEGENRYLGRELFSIFKSAGLNSIEIYPFPLHVTQDNPQYLKAAVNAAMDVPRNSKEGLIEGGWATEEDFIEMEKEAEAVINHPGAFGLSMFFFATGIP